VIPVASPRAATVSSTSDPAALGTTTEATVEVCPPVLVTGTSEARLCVAPVNEAEPPVKRWAAAKVTATVLVPEGGLASPHISTRTWF
jgi:hypothetical protein